MLHRFNSDIKISIFYVHSFVRLRLYNKWLIIKYVQRSQNCDESIGFRANQQLCDGVIRCPEDQVFPVHRAILSAVSPYFKALFTNSLKGGKIETTEVVISVPGEIFSLILDYAYTGTCNVNVDNVEQLLPLADQFEVLGIVQLCCQFLLQELRPENCLGK